MDKLLTHSTNVDIGPVGHYLIHLSVFKITHCISSCVHAQECPHKECHNYWHHTKSEIVLSMSHV